MGGFLPEGSFYSYLTGGPAAGSWCLKVRVIEYLVDVEGQETGEMFCLITDLYDYVAFSASEVAGIYAWRWTGSQTAVIFFSSRRRHTRSLCDWSSDVCSSD